MESKNEFKKYDIKNRTCYCFDEVMRYIDIYSGDILLEEESYKTYENILIYDISYKTFIGSIPLRIRFDQTDWFIKIYDGLRHLDTYLV